MRATDIIRNVLDIIDQVTPDASSDTPADSSIEVEIEPGSENRFKQIFDLISAEKSPCELANAPDEKYADIDAVTVLAGGGVNGPKHPHDIRVKDPSEHPMQQRF